MRKTKKSRNMTTNRTNRSRTNGSPSLRGISSYLVDGKGGIRFNVKLFKFLQMIMTRVRGADNGLMRNHKKIQKNFLWVRLKSFKERV